MTDTPIELLKLILAECEPDCTCECPFELPPSGQQAAIERPCLHCRIEKVVEEHDREIAYREEYWGRIQDLQRQLASADRVANEYRERLEEARLI